MRNRLSWGVLSAIGTAVVFYYLAWVTSISSPVDWLEVLTIVLYVVPAAFLIGFIVGGVSE